LIAGATLGLAASVVWTVFGALEVAVLAWLEALLMGEAFADSETRLFVVGTLYVMLATVQGFLIYIDTLREKSQSALRRSNAELRQARDEREEDIAVFAAEQVRMEAELELAESTQMKLRELHEAKSEVLRMVGHDVRSPLSEIMGATGLIKDECGDDDDSQVAVYADLILQSGDRIRDLLESILVMEQLESGLIEPNLSYADPTDIFSSTASDFKIRARAKQIEVSADLGDERPLIQTDVNMLRQVFQNLLSNAIKYSPVGGRVSISQTLEGRNVLFAIRDTGPGIPEEEYARLFLPFSKLRNRPTAGESSTGVGLAIVKSLAERIGAVISFESDVGVGTVFYIRINLDAAE
jgi:signal transduction histidine kinase